MSVIAVFDSGLGGLSILRALRRRLPRRRFLYYADQAHVPYGRRSLDEVRRLAHEAVGRLRFHEPRLGALVVACHTASAAALSSLRAEHPDLPVIGMEPAVKPAAEQTHSGVVGVIATAATFQGRLYESVVERFAEGVRVIALPCPGLVERIEAGDFDSPGLVAWLADTLAPLRAAGIDRLVLGCTHFPLAARALAQAAGPGVELVDPSDAVARQVERRLAVAATVATVATATAAANAGGCVYWTSGAPARFDELAGRLLGETIRSRAAPEASVNTGGTPRTTPG